MNNQMNIKIEVQGSPKGFDVAFAPCDESGSPGNLNMFILNELGIHTKSGLPDSKQLTQGFAKFESRESKCSVVFIVTVSLKNSDILLKNNLSNALESLSKNWDNKRIWIPLMGVGVGNLDLRDSFKVIYNTILDFTKRSFKPGEMVISVPQKTDSDTLGWMKAIVASGESIPFENEEQLREKEQQTRVPADSNEKLKKLLVPGRRFFAVEYLWSKNDQMDRFIQEKIWESELDSKDSKTIIDVNAGDILFGKLTISDYLRIDAIGAVINNIKDGHKLSVIWHRINPIGIQEIKGVYKGSIERIKRGDEKRFLTVLLSGQPNLFEIISELDGSGDKEKALFTDPNKASNQYWWINANEKNWNIDDFKIGEEQSYRTHNKINKSISRRQVFQHFFEVNVGDLAIGYQVGPKGKTKAIFEITKKATNPNGDTIKFKIIEKIPELKQISFPELKNLDYFRQSEVVTRNNQGSIFQLTSNQFHEVYKRAPVGNITSVTKTGLDNDGAFTTEDLLDIENDVRSFALILASQDIKPPIAVALFGKWGSGKSFFMEHLSKRVSELSINQGFIEEGETLTEEEEKNKEEAFCKGIAQIKFNAWSYLDANLWAGLVSSIFEKLDEYISNRSKGDREKLELRKQLSEKLEILSTEKKGVKSEIGSLEEEKEDLKGRLETLKSDKEKLIKNIAEKKLSEIIDAVRSKTKIEEKVKVELQKYGITEERINELSPTELFSEVNSWVAFFKNLFKFSTGYIVVFIVAAAALLFVWIDPNKYASDFFNQIGREITAVISILGPLFAKGYNTFAKFKKITEPITDYKNKFNKELKEAKFEYEQEKSLLEIKIKTKQTEIEQAEVKITEINAQIEDLNYTLNNFVAKRAFNNFIKRKVSDKRYEEHLGLISIIRKDFETLSDLFIETLVDVKAPEEIQIKQQEKLDEHKEIVKLFEDEKVLNRIILYIDDLDRCSDEKVLEVIQAVHLLMAFPLFNVVVGVDKRCVNNALIYKNLLQYSQFTSLDNIEKIGIHVISPGEYLEKIFQIPFQLDDPSDEDIKGMVDVLLNNQIEEEIPAVEEKPSDTEPTYVFELKGKGDEDTKTSMLKDPQVFNFISTDNQEDVAPKKKNITITPKDLKLTKVEFEMLKEIIWLVGSIPRTVKRYINIYRIIRAHQDLHINADDQRKEFLTLMFLLAINIGEYKEHAPKLLYDIKLNKNKRLEEYLVGHDDLTEIKDKIKSAKLIEDLLQYEGAQFYKHIPFVGRFSFANIEYSNNLADKKLNAK